EVLVLSRPLSRSADRRKIKASKDTHMTRNILAATAFVAVATLGAASQQQVRPPGGRGQAPAGPVGRGGPNVGGALAPMPNPKRPGLAPGGAELGLIRVAGAHHPLWIP